MLNDACLKLHNELGIPSQYGTDAGLPVFKEATDLTEVGPNLVGRMQTLTPRTAAAWQRLVEASGEDGVRLLIVSGFRSYAYQAELIRNKLKAGQDIAAILTVNAAPGFSQHHTGAAIDIATPGSRPLTEEFEDSDAFAWLTREAANFGFTLTYPPDNEFGFVYEPWHWAYETGIESV